MAGRRKGVFKRCRMRGYEAIETGQRRKNQQKFPEIPRETLVNYSSSMSATFQYLSRIIPGKNVLESLEGSELL